MRRAGNAWRLALIGLLLCPGAGAEQLPTRLYTTADGLPNNWVNCIRQDPRGYLWMCTREGLARFDGYNFVHYGPAEGLTAISVTDLLIAGDKEYWVGATAGLFRFDPSGQPRFIEYRSSPDPGAHSIRTLALDRYGTIWIGTQSGLYRRDVRSDPNQPPERVELEDPTAPIRSLLVDRNHNVWIAGEHLYRRIEQGRIERVKCADGIRGLQTLLEDRDGSLWVGADDGLFRIDPPLGVASPQLARPRVTPADGLKHGAQIIHQTTDGRFWIDSWDGLAEVIERHHPDGLSLRPYNFDSRMKFDGVRSMGEDREGNLWLGCTFGAMRVARNGLVSYGADDGLGSLRVASIFDDHAGRLFVLTTGTSAHLNAWDGRRFNGPAIGLSGTDVMTSGWYQIALSDRNGEWWIATRHGGLLRYPKISRIDDVAHWKPKARYSVAEGLTGFIYRVYEDSRGDIWVATGDDGGLSRWDRATQKFVRYGQAQGLPALAASDEYPPTAFREDRSGAVWVGSKNWLARYREGKFTVFGKADGLKDLFVVGLHLDRAGRLWVAAAAGGLYRVDNPAADRPHFQAYGSAQGLSSNRVNCVTEDQQGRIYVCTGRGVDRLDPALPVDPVRVRHYTTADGLAMGELQEAFCDREGRLWFGTLHGLSSLKPEPERPRHPPPVLVTGLQIQGRRHAISGLGASSIPRLILDPDQNQVRLDFMAPDFAAGDALRYQYKLEGADTDWSLPGEERTVNYARLAAGDYRFLVRALNSSGQADASPASVEFTVLAPVWRRWWFMCLAAVLAASAIYGVYRYQLSHALALERMRTRIATDLHDDIGASLSQIAIMSELARQDRNGSAVAEIANLSRDMVDAMSEIVWAINPRHDKVSNLVHRMRRYASDTLEACDIQLEFRTVGLERDIRAPAEIRRQVLLIFKEAVANIARHSKARNVEAVLESVDGRLRLVLKDDGRGFDTLRVSDGNGLHNMPERARSVGGTLVIKSQPGQGATLDLTVPLGRRGSSPG